MYDIILDIKVGDIMNKYPIKKCNVDYHFIDVNTSLKGTREKKVVKDTSNNKAIFKYEGEGYQVSEACSEKISYEIAKVLGYDCAQIELAKDEDGRLGILNYLFVDIDDKIHMDAVVYLNKNNERREQFYTLENIKQTLDELDKNLFKDFIKIMFFDALVGEQDRHEENWGIEIIDDCYKISPLYDNGCNLLREFKNENLAKKYYNGQKNFDSYIERSKTFIYNSKTKKRYKHFELIKHLNERYPIIMKNEILKLDKLNDSVIEKIVNKIPDELITRMHKDYIILYVRKRRDMLKEICLGGDSND